MTFKIIDVSGSLIIGTPSCPIQSALVFTVPGGDATFGINALPGSKVDIHGTFIGRTWTRLASTAAAGAKALLLKEPVQWAAGDKLFVATTLWKDELLNQNEVMTVASVTPDGLTVNTVEALQFNHYGGEYQAEVGLLTRRILFTSDAASSTTALGPHTTFWTPDARVSGAGYERWGARNIAGRYSVHFHLAGEAPNAYIKNNAFYNSNCLQGRCGGAGGPAGGASLTSAGGSLVDGRFEVRFICPAF
ncbi:hypothetical protein MNEG_16356 [Monoraphidium neglectum]|uniref:G8 domain-containing protein n=1 Tax=Monoraphidium neglectum TaxID=145388 RepID=A0A0D2K641_9CHLO|nr:hypothetical protein MNEG_16356 [Monoraphidium neglectum]KIY91608.1 hypothetical protein MNEG_16356 [Monoraphidium neglectum]|eukprot:XP_013890628.1 hypothetical protein MNEG_16356 [Monoraphidium neglectum]